ncbi:MAG: LysR family transcriptional regulator [Zoogloeaceae bacterium]|nr:LysR family transcriptional regulator [Zoogloeaceae bacterium]
MDKLRQMQAFTAVAEQGSFVGAAESLGTSKAAISRLVADLEARLGVRLMQRTTRRLTLTTEGHLFLERCRDALTQIEDAENELQHATTVPRGLVRVNVPVTFGNLHLAPLWGEFLALHPLVELDVTLADRVVDLVEEGYDLAVRIGRLAPSTLISRQVATDHSVLCAAPAYLEKYGTPTHPADLERHHTIGYSYLSTGDRWVFEGKEGETSIRVRPRLRANSGDTCRAVALAGQGIIQQPTFLIGDDLRAGRLLPLLADWRAIEFGIHLVYPSRRFLPPKMRVLIAFLAERLGARDHW